VFKTARRGAGAWRWRAIAGLRSAAAPLDAPADGEVSDPVGEAESRGAVHSDIVTRSVVVIIPTKVREYTLLSVMSR